MKRLASPPKLQQVYYPESSHELVNLLLLIVPKMSANVYAFDLMALFSPPKAPVESVHTEYHTFSSEMAVVQVSLEFVAAHLLALAQVQSIFFLNRQPFSVIELLLAYWLN